MADPVTHYEGDHFGPIEAELFEKGGERVDFEGVDSVHMELYRLGRVEAVFDVEADVVGDGQEATVKLELEADDEDALKVKKGTYRFVWRVTKSGRPKHYPEAREDWHVLVCDRAGTVPAEEP